MWMSAPPTTEDAVILASTLKDLFLASAIKASFWQKTQRSVIQLTPVDLKGRNEIAVGKEEHDYDSTMTHSTSRTSANTHMDRSNCQ